MAIDLVTPGLSNFLKDFPGQNAVNCDLVDNYAGPCLTSHPLQSFNPELNATTTKPTLGTGGFSIAWAYEIFDQVFMWGQFRFGSSGFNAGSGIYYLQLPFDITNILASSTNLGKSPVIGTAATHDNDNNLGKLPLTVHLRTASQLQFGIRINSGVADRELRNSGYITWAANDGVNWCGRGKKAV